MATRGNALRITRQLTLAIVGLALVGGTLLGRARVTSWEETLWVGIYPIAGDQSAVTVDYLRDLDARRFASIETFMASEAGRYGVALKRPFRLDLGKRIDTLPPTPPAQPNPLSVIAWSLKLRWWASTATSDQTGPEPDIRLFVIYYDPNLADVLPHSVGLKEGRLGIAHVFADPSMEGSNRVVIAHELLHTLGATDKYAEDSNLPRFPDGFAEPERTPRLPQRYAELMGGRIPISEDEADMPASLGRVRIGQVTAAELRWPDILH